MPTDDPHATEIEVGRKRRSEPVNLDGKALYPETTKALGDQLDSHRVTTLQRRLFSNFLEELDIQGAWREEMAKDEDFYDSIQWKAEDEAVLRERGQEPLVMNVVCQAINWIIGTQKNARTDYKILPRKKAASGPAERKSQYLKYIADVHQSQFSMSDAFSEMVRAGLSFIECGVQDDADGEPVFERFESWRNVIFDSAGREKDLSDGRHFFRVKWVDVDTACGLFPKRRDQIIEDAGALSDNQVNRDSYGDDPMDSAEEAREGASGYGNAEGGGQFTRSRIRLIEAWFRIPETIETMLGGEFSGEVFDPTSPGHAEQLESGEATLKSRISLRTYCMIMTANHALWFGPSPYRHNKFPFTPMFCFRRARDGAPYGMIRNMRSPQEDLNKRFSKALAILSSNKVIMDEGAVADMDDFEEEVSRPNAIIVKKPGKHLELSADRNLAQGHLDLLQLDMQFVQMGSGITDEVMGRTTNAVSGKAIMARQEQGMVSTGAAFDAYRAARQYHGEKLLSLVEQFATEEKELRITDARGKPDFIQINDGVEANDIVRTKADFIISEDAWNATIRQAQVTALMELMTQLAPVAPNIVTVLLDLVVETMDIPSRDEIVKRIRSVTGMEDPDADPNTPDPEREKREQQKALQAAMEQRAAEANLSKLEGEAAKAMAAAQKEAANAQKLFASMPGESLEEKRRALELAMLMFSSPPGAVDTADALLVETAQPAPQPQAPQPQQPQQQAPNTQPLAPEPIY
ncbi:hypothetical protein JI664_21465 [Rhodobacter sp. NTK016B]|uniref:portal protein n=1 Tax=Rhodobacter sp. NTK016B TaxID=2759676 RepID=UPI001A8E600C|nr:hypothetical protein [Rhodobacter sp. NTK016B]MBN8294556.1 hypothetical protein [Rhodobacter sp. NTK016B]